MELLLLLEWLAFAAASMHVLYLILFRRESAKQEAPEDAERKAQVDAAAEGAEKRHSETRAPLADGGAVDISAMGFTSEEVVRTRLEAVSDLGETSLELHDVILKELPATPGLERLRFLTLRIATPDMPMPGLKMLTSLTRLQLYGAALRKDILETIAQLPQLQCLDLSESRAVVDVNNDVESFCQAQNIFEFQRSRKLNNLLVPSLSYVRIGHVVKAFPKAQVIVVALEQPLRLGDIVCLQRVNADFDAMLLDNDGITHRWRSQQTTLDSIRTDDHTQLEDAVPDPAQGLDNIDNQVAFRVNEMGRAGDDVLWCGHASLSPLRLRPKKVK